MNAYIVPAPSTHAVPNYFYFSVAKAIQQRSDDPDERCCYPSKLCDKPRVVKRNGELHRFCEEHQSRANLNQRKLEERRRHVQSQQEQQSLASYMARLDQQYGISDTYATQFDTHQQPSDLLLGLDLDEEDLRVLAAIFSVGSSME
uniref:Uncharacterized protein n=1 Tax=Globisporangium ultimum (strain ATCC 200006 / CBS 805.95 / DAOM BR144) TaxID=431595 RepID=K3W7M3_GLOUD